MLVSHYCLVLHDTKILGSTKCAVSWIDPRSSPCPEWHRRCPTAGAEPVRQAWRSRGFRIWQLQQLRLSPLERSLSPKLQSRCLQGQGPGRSFRSPTPKRVQVGLEPRGRGCHLNHRGDALGGASRDTTPVLRVDSDIAAPNTPASSSAEAWSRPPSPLHSKLAATLAGICDIAENSSGQWKSSGKDLR